MAEAARRWALVTGAGSGMGLSIARRFLAEGWGVAALDVSDANLARLDGDGASEALMRLACDVADRDAVRAALDGAGIGAQVACAITAAGIYPPTNLDTFTTEIAHRVFDVNVLGTLNVAAEAIRLMRQHGTPGAIVTISSADAFTASTQQLIYSASKAAVVSLTRVVAKTVAGDDIVVNGIAPGWVNTPGNEATGRMVGAEAHIPLGRVAQPEEIAEWAWLLGSRTGPSFMTGETLKVTGGELMS